MTPSHEQGQGFISKLGDRASNVSAILAVLGVILYAVLRIAYSIFYSPFRLYPDDLGLGYVDLLVQSAVGVFLLLMAMFLVVLLVVTLYLWSRRVLGRVRAEAAGADAAEPKPADAETAEPEAGGAETAEPEAGGAETAEPKPAEAEATEPKPAEAEATEPEAVGFGLAQADHAATPLDTTKAGLTGVHKVLRAIKRTLEVIAWIVWGVLLYGGLAAFVLHRIFDNRLPIELVLLGDFMAVLLALGMVWLFVWGVEVIIERFSRLRGRPWREAIVRASGYSAHQWRLATITVASLAFVIATGSLLGKALYDRSQVLSGDAAALLCWASQ